MDFIRRLLETEAAITIGVVAAFLGLLVSFGVTLDNAQVEAIKDFVANVLAFAGAIMGIRQAVYSQRTHQEELAEAMRYGSNSVASQATPGDPTR